MSMLPNRSNRSATPNADGATRTTAVCADCGYEVPSKRCLDGSIEPLTLPSCPECGGEEFVGVEYDNPMQGE